MIERIGDIMSSKIMDGNEACAYVSYPFTEVAGIYPITPSSTMAELVDKWSSDGVKNYFDEPVKVVQMQSEAGASGMVHGSLQAGCLTTTYTASQGLLLMIPNMYKMAGEQLPCVIHVASRSLATHALSIFGDHQDIYATRMTGFAILSSSSVQEVMDLTAVAHLAAIKGRVPFLHFFDGFRTSHELQKIEVIDTKLLMKLIDKKALKAFRNNALVHQKVTRGTNQNDDIYFQATEVRNSYYQDLPDIVENYMEEISKLTGRCYAPFMYYGSKKAKRLIIAMGSVSETIKEVVDDLNQDNEEVGFVEVHLYRPFSAKHLLKVIPDTIEKIAVLDRTKEPGSGGEPLYLDVVEAMKSRKITTILGGRYGLSSKNTNPSCIKAVFDFLERDDCFSNFTVGIHDDVTNLSISIPDYHIKNKYIEFLVYGYGSDGMVSACKDLMKITGEHTNAFVQGYFQYDSKKSGGVTKSHLRFSKSPIRATYYVENPTLIVCTLDSYMKKFAVLENIQENGTFLLNTTKTVDEVLAFLNQEDILLLKERKIKFYIVDALSIAKKVGLDHKISAIMETIIFKLSHLMSSDFAIDKIKENISLRFAKKSGDVVGKNLKAIDLALSDLTLVSLSDIKNTKKNNEVLEAELSIFDRMDKGLGDTLPVSAFKNLSDGTFDGGMSRLEKREISSFAPCFIKENCIQCNLCSLVCPHAVIRPFLLDENETKKAPKVVKNDLLKANIKDKDLNFVINPSIQDCTGCMLCVNICPGKKGQKALEMQSIKELKEKGKIEESKYLFDKVIEKKVMPLNTVKGSQFATPKFEFSGACAGCGETPYLKLLTQLFNERLVIANATGCSSIYSSSVPNTPYSIPWANSLFEDNAEYGYGMAVADSLRKQQIKRVMEKYLDKIEPKEKRAYKNYLKEVTLDTANDVLAILPQSKNKELKALEKDLMPKSIWMVGGDGWAYDIGFSGIDHVLASRENVNILVLDTEVYSNTGGQSSKSSKIGSVAKFTSKGKEQAKKDLAKIALTYPHVYVGSISLGANYQQTIKVLTDADSYQGPSIVLAYSPCIAQGILKGMENTILEEKRATESGYYPIFHYDPRSEEFSLDSKANFDLYDDFLEGEDRYQILKKVNKEKAKQLLSENKENAIKRYQYYQNLANQNKKNEEKE